MYFVTLHQKNTVLILNMSLILLLTVVRITVTSSSHSIHPCPTKIPILLLKKIIYFLMSFELPIPQNCHKPSS